MQQVQLTDQLYRHLARRAAEAGFDSVDEYVAEVLTSGGPGETENLDHLFTPERLAHIDKAAAAIKAGQFHTAAQVREHFKKRFEV